MAERIRNAFAAAAAEVDGRPVNATVSICVVVSEEAVVDIPNLLAQADQALYCAKERGRNRVEFASLELFVRPAESLLTEFATVHAKSAA